MTIPQLVTPENTDFKVFFTRDGTAEGVGKSASQVLLGVTHISRKLSAGGHGVESHERWLADFKAIAEKLSHAVEHSDEIRTDRRELTPEVEAALKAWLDTYAAAKTGVETVLRLQGKVASMPRIFYDLAVPAYTKVTEAPTDDEGVSIDGDSGDIDE